METNFSFTLEGDAIHIELNGRKYRIGYQQAEMPYAEAQAWCRERGGVLGSVELLRAIARHRDEEINPALVAAGKEPFSDDWYWTDEECFWLTGNAYVVGMVNGDVSGHDKGCSHYVRAVSALN